MNEPDHQDEGDALAGDETRAHDEEEAAAYEAADADVEATEEVDAAASPAAEVIDDA